MPGYMGFDPAKFTLNSPIFTGAPTSPTPPVLNNSTRLATTAFVRSELLSLGNAVYDAIFGKSLAANGWQKLPSGLIIQWGVTAPLASGANLIVTLPLSFPTAHLGVATGGRGTQNGTVPTYYGWDSISTSQFRIYNQSTQNGFTNWLAWGY